MPYGAPLMSFKLHGRENDQRQMTRTIQNRFENCSEKVTLSYVQHGYETESAMREDRERARKRLHREAWRTIGTGGERGGEKDEGARRVLDFGDYKTLVSVVICTVNKTGEVQRKRILFSPDFLDPRASVTSRFRHSLGLGLSPLSLSYFEFQAPLGPNSSQVPKYIHECRDIAHSTNARSWFVVQTQGCGDFENFWILRWGTNFLASSVQGGDQTRDERGLVFGG